MTQKPKRTSGIAVSTGIHNGQQIPFTSSRKQDLGSEGVKGRAKRPDDVHFFIGLMEPIGDGKRHGTPEEALAEISGGRKMMV